MTPRILIANEALAHGGIGTYTRSLVGGLRSRGWEIQLVVTHGPGEHFRETADLCTGAVDLSFLGLGRQKLREFRSVVDGFAPDVFLLNHCSLAHYLLPRMSPRVKPVSVLHADVHLFYSTASLFPHRIFRWIAPSKRVGDTFVRRFPRFAQGRVRTIQHGIDARTFFAEPQSGRNAVTFVGNLGENKGAHLLPAIFEKVHSLVPGATFQIAGGGDLKDWLARECVSRGVPVRFLGVLDADEVREALARSAVLLLPSRGEGFGLVVAEAMMCGAVPVVSRLPGSTDQIVDDGRTGFLVDVDDVDGFARAAASVLLDEHLFDALSSAACARAREHFTLERMLDDYERLFQEPDDRTPVPRRGAAGWGAEVAREMLSVDSEGRLRLRQKVPSTLSLLRNR